MTKHAHQFRPKLAKHPFPNKGDFLALMTKDDRKPSNIQVVKSIDKLYPQLTLEECDELNYWLVIHILLNDDPDPEYRRRLLSLFDSCPCCEHWLGHNNPPAGAGEPEPPYRKQRSFKFNR